jgi:hypothetical protein
MKSTVSILTVIVATSFSSVASAQVTLTGTSYSEDFNNLSSGLPTGWTVSTAATSTTLGTAATFTTDPISWGSAASSGVFRNTSGLNIAASSNSSTQSSNTDRALGWRPNLAGEREGAITLQLSNTTGFQNFNLSLSVYTFNDVTAVATYVLEYRVGSSGSFTQLGSTYTTGAAFSEQTYSVTSTSLTALNDQNSPVFIRLRGTTSSGTGSLDGVAIDNFSLSYSAVPEPSTLALLVGTSVLGLAAFRRRSRPAKPAHLPAPSA